MALLHRVIRWVPLACSICFTSKGKSFQPASISAIKAIGCTAREQGKGGRARKKKKEHEKERLVVFFSFHGSQHNGETQMMSIIWTSCLLRACVLGCVACTGREAANECSVALPLSHSKRPEYMKAVETANIAHQISSAVLRGRLQERAIQGQHACLFTS